MVTKRYKYSTVEAALAGRGESQRFVALSCGIGAAHFSEILSGRKAPSLDVALRLAAHLGVPPDALSRPRRER